MMVIIWNNMPNAILLKASVSFSRASLQCGIQHAQAYFECDGFYIPDSKVHGAKMGPIRGRQDPGGPHVGPMKFVVWAWLLQLMPRMP